MSAEAVEFAERIPEPLLPDQVSELVQYTHTAAARAVGCCSHDTIIGSIGDTSQKDTHTQGACTERGRRGSGACSGDNFNKNDSNNDNNSGNKNENDTENVVGNGPENVDGNDPENVDGNDPENADGSDGGDEGRVNLRGPRVPKALSSEALNSGHPHQLPKTRHMSRMFEGPPCFVHGRNYHGLCRWTRPLALAFDRGENQEKAAHRGL